MLTDVQQRNAAKKFAAEWNGKGYEKGQTHDAPQVLKLSDLPKLTETYLSLRKLENRCLEIINADETVFGFDDVIKVSIGFSTADNAKPKMIFDSQTGQTSQTSQTGLTCQTINAYLTNAPDVFIESRNKPLCKIPAIRKAHQANDRAVTFQAQF